MLYRPVVEKLVAALGALITHQVAYLLVSLLGPSIAAPTDHGHLSTQWAVVAPVAIGAAALFIVRQLRALGFHAIVSTRQLSGFVVAFFIVQELVEGLIAGVPIAELVRHPAIATGVLLAPLVAWLLVRILDGVGELAARFLTAPTPLFPPARPRLVPIPVRVRARIAGSPSRPRAPPSSLRR